MIVTLLLPPLLGILLLHRLLKFEEPVGLLSAGWAVGWLYALMTVNFALLAGASLDTAVKAMLGLCLGLTAVLLWVRGPKVRGPGFARATWAFLAVGALAVYVTTNTILYLNPDDDYFLHAPLQGQLLKGIFPIINPFLPDVFYGGHYARDLIVVVAAKLSGFTVFEVQAPVTVALQLSTFLVLFTALHRATRSQLQAALGTFLVFAGAIAGFRGGWLDTVANNNALAQSICALVFLFSLEALFVRPRPAATVLTGLTLGGLAWAYETNFTVVCLGLCGLALSTLVLRRLTKGQLITALAVVCLTLPLAIVQGGVFQHLFEKIRGGRELAASTADLTLQSQNLEVSAKFPKDALFQIKLDRSGEEMSMAYSTLPFLRDLPKTGGTPGYVSVFSWYAIRIHWLALYLAPLSLVWLLRSKNWAGLLLWWVGCSGYFLPSVVDFGLWEAEVFRWQFVAAWGFAGALGIALGQWWEGIRGPCFSLSSRNLLVRKKGVAAVALGLLLGLNSYPCFHQMRQRTAQLDSWWGGFGFPRASVWFDRQPEVDLHPVDIRAGLWLSDQVSFGEKLLTNFRDENEFNIYFESSFLGLCGLRPVGHTFPLPFERLGTRPFRQNAATRAFWASLDVSLLGSLQPDWIYVRGRTSEELEGLAGLSLAHREDEKHALFKVEVPSLQEGEPVAGVRFERLELPTPLAVEQYVLAPLTLRNVGTEPIKAETTFLYELIDRDGVLVEGWERFLQPVKLELLPGERQVVQVHFVAPHQEGEYRLRCRLGSESVAGEQPVSVGTRRLTSALEVLEAEPLDPLKAGQIARFRVRLKNPSKEKLGPETMLAALVAKEPSVPIHLVRDFSEVLLVIPAHGETELVLPVVVPEVMNGFELKLLPRDGWNVWELPAAGP